MESRPARLRAVVAQARPPRKLAQAHDDANVDASACPCTALLDGMPSRMLRLIGIELEN